MFLCLRIDLDYVPWDTPDAEAFGHGEPAMVLRLLDLARASGHRYHFFASNRVLRAFPATAEAVLNEGHDLDWFCKHPVGDSDRRSEANSLFDQLGHKPLGLCLRNAWPESEEPLVDTTGLRFLSAAPGIAPEGLTLFPVEARPPRDAARAGLTARAWTDATKSLVRDFASRRRDLTVSIRPQVLAKFDAKLAHVKEILDIGIAAGMTLKTLRQVLKEIEPA
jgi:hypothetical protein